MDEFVLNVRQIAQYPASQPQPADTVLIQQGGMGGPYASTSIQDLVAAGSAQLAPSAIPGGVSTGQLFAGSLSMPLYSSVAYNGYWDTQSTPRRLEIGPACFIDFDPVDGSLRIDLEPLGQANTVCDSGPEFIFAQDGTLTAGRVQIGTTPVADADAVTVRWVNTSAVRSFNGRYGQIVLNGNDILRAGGALICNPAFQGQPLAPTADSECRHQIANVEFVECRIADWINGLINEHPFVWTFNGRRGDIVLNAMDTTNAAFLDPAVPPAVPTAPDGTATDQAASTAFVAQGLDDLQTFLEGEIANSGDVTVAYLEANYAPLVSPPLSGNPTAPTAAPGSSTGQIATTAFVMNAVAAATSGVASFNGRTGAVELSWIDVSQAGGAPINGPIFTGNPQAPTPTAGNSSTSLATTAFVAAAVAAVAAGVSSFNTRTGAVTLTLADVNATNCFFNTPLSGNPTASTANAGDSSTRIATTAFVAAAIAAIAAGVVTFNGRAGAVTLQANDVSAVGGALLGSPAFTGNPTAPTQPGTDSSTRLATTAFVHGLVGSTGVATFNTRSGAVVLLAADLTGAGGALLASPTFTGTPAGPTPTPGDSSTALATTAFVAAALAALPGNVSSFNTRTGAVTLQANDVSAVGGALLASPSFTGTPSAPTAANATSTTQIATTQFVHNLVGAGGGVASFNTRSGAVTLLAADVTGVGGALSANVLPLTGGTLTGALICNTTFQANGGVVFNGGGQFYSAGGMSTSAGPGLFQLYNVAFRSDYYLGPLGYTPNSLACNPSYAWGCGTMGIAGGGAIYGRADNSSAYNFGVFWGVGTLVGSISTNGSSTSFNSTSDVRLKMNVRDIADELDPGELIDAIRPVAFEWRDRKGVVGEPGAVLTVGKGELGKGQRRARGTATGHGFVAQELIEVAPYAVHAPDDGKRQLGDMGEGLHTPWAVDFSKLVPYLVAELQAVRRRLQALEGTRSKGAKA